MQIFLTFTNKRLDQVLPNDEREQERLDLLHHVFRLSLDGGLCKTILDNPQKILDVGTGTGIWAIESEKHHLQEDWETLTRSR